MCAVLVTQDALETQLGLAPGQDASLLTTWAAQATKLFEKQCGRDSIPFSDALTGRIEVQEARGSTRLWLDYPIASIAGIKLGRNFTSPDETLDPTDPEAVFFQVGRRELLRTDGNVWSAASGGLLSWARGGPMNAGMDQDTTPSFVQVTYTTAADLPGDAALAIANLVAKLYRKRGSEEVSVESVAGVSRTMAKLVGDDDEWLAAVQANTRSTFR